MADPPRHYPRLPKGLRQPGRVEVAAYKGVDRVRKNLFETSKGPMIGFLLLGLGVIGSVVVYPMMNIDKFRKNQEWRKGLDQEKLQPAGMRVWSNPFETKSD